MLEQTLKAKIPSTLPVFPKLTPDHDPYYFGSWDSDANGSILRYWFWNKDKSKKNRKRVFVREIRSLLRDTQRKEVVSRSDFEKCCPKTAGDGGCGFAVIIRIFESLGVVTPNDGEYRVKNPEKIYILLGSHKSITR